MNFQSSCGLSNPTAKSAAAPPMIENDVNANPLPNEYKLELELLVDFVIDTKSLDRQIDG